MLQLIIAFRAHQIRYEKRFIVMRIQTQNDGRYIYQLFDLLMHRDICTNLLSTLPTKQNRKRDKHTVNSSSADKPGSDPRVVVQTLSEVDIVNDGYRWRKYGQKLVKGNPNPRFVSSKVYTIIRSVSNGCHTAISKQINQRVCCLTCTQLILFMVEAQVDKKRLWFKLLMVSLF